MIEPANFVTKYRLYEEAIKILHREQDMEPWLFDKKIQDAIGRKREELIEERNALVKNFCRERKSP